MNGVPAGGNLSPQISGVAGFGRHARAGGQSRCPRQPTQLQRVAPAEGEPPGDTAGAGDPFAPQFTRRLKTGQE